MSQMDAMLATFAQTHCPPAASLQASRWIPTRLRRAPTASSPTSSTVSGTPACRLDGGLGCLLGCLEDCCVQAPSWLPCCASAPPCSPCPPSRHSYNQLLRCFPDPCAGICNTGKLIVGIHVTTTEMTDGPPPQIQVRVRQARQAAVSAQLGKPCGWGSCAWGSAMHDVCACNECCASLRL